MRCVAVVGANGHVGAEVCLNLSVMPDIRVVPICRSELGASLLRRCGLDCRIGVISTPEGARALLAGSDLVVDFSLPGGLPSEIRGPMRANITNAINEARSGAPYVFISTTSAFGMPSAARKYARYIFARSSYASSKRYGERLTRALGVLRRRLTYVLRLGQVHGELQRVSRALLSPADERPIVLAKAGETPSDTVFCSTIAQSIRNIGYGLDAPGRYTLLESPGWTWRHMYEFYAEQRGAHATILDAGDAQGGVRSLCLAALGAGMGVLQRNRELLTAQMPVFAPALEQRLKSVHLARSAAAEIARRQASLYLAPKHWDGPVPGKRLASLAGAAGASAATAVLVRKLLEERLGPHGHNFII
jgi:nucleoside-diphosphate-sugar epimerase